MHSETIQGNKKVPLLTETKVTEKKNNLNVSTSFLSDEVTVQGWGES